MLERADGKVEAANAGGTHFPKRPKLSALCAGLPVEIPENWIEAIRYLNMEPLEDRRK
jgi:hypothetical protein